MSRSLGLIVWCCWLAALAGGAQAYGAGSRWPGHGRQVLLALWVVAFVYHFCNGIRHLFWDAGKGLERAQARSSGRVVVIAVAVVSALLLVALFRSPAA